MKISLPRVATLLFLSSACAANSGEPSFNLLRGDVGSVDKRQYNLFNPVPHQEMRILSADRPDATESPFTVDPGHIQIESTFFSYAHDDENGVELEAWTTGSFNIKFGLLHNMDLQFVFDAYTEERTTIDGGDTEKAAGFSDLQLRLKINLWGNDGGRSGFAIFPFIKIPTGTDLSNNEFEGGLILPFAFSLTDRLNIGVQGEFDAVYIDDQYELEFLHTAVIGIALTDQLGVYIEYLGSIGSGSLEDYQASFSSGFTWATSENVQFDVGTVLGLTDAANDYSIFSGVTVRF